MSWRVDIIGHNWLIRRKWQHLNPLNDQIRHKFNQIDPFLKFIVQGSQKKYVRVAISQKFDEVFFQFPTRIIAKLVIENTTVVALLEDFVRKPYLFSEVCTPCWRRCGRPPYRRRTARRGSSSCPAH